MTPAIVPVLSLLGPVFVFAVLLFVSIRARVTRARDAGPARTGPGPRLARAMSAFAREWDLAHATGSGARIGLAWARAGFVNAWRGRTYDVPPPAGGAGAGAGSSSSSRASLAGARARAQARRKTRMHADRAIVWARVQALCEAIAVSSGHEYVPRWARVLVIRRIFQFARMGEHYNAIQAQKWARLTEAPAEHVELAYPHIFRVTR